MTSSVSDKKCDWPRIVAHADMDSFYAAIEQLDDPSLRGKPVLVGGGSHRGVVMTASYEARPFGVGSAMPMRKAKRLCPDAIVVPPRFERYRQVSETIMQVFSEFSPTVEALSLDEAFLDMTGAEGIFGDPEKIGYRIKDAIREATNGLTASIGLSGTKYVAKVASAYRKPDGLTLVEPHCAKAWLAPQPVSRLWGAGPKTQTRLHEIGLKTIGDVACADPNFLFEKLGNSGLHFFALANAEDERGVSRRRIPKSIGSERTLSEDVSSASDIKRHLRTSADRIASRLKKKKLSASGVRVKLKTSSFEILSRQRSLAQPTDVGDQIYKIGAELLADFDDAGPFRLIGMAAYELAPTAAPVQMDLFGQSTKHRRLEAAIDQLNLRYASGTVRRARDLAGRQGDRLGATLDFLDDE